VIGGASRPGVPLILIAILFFSAGVLHFVMPKPFESIVPAWLPSPAALVMVSGVCEILGGVGVLVPLARVAAGWGLIALLVAVFPANVNMLMQAHARHASAGWQLALVARLPLQALLIWWVWREAVSRR
jgi:uncharacterized membrane protein